MSISDFYDLGYKEATSQRLVLFNKKKEPKDHIQTTFKLILQPASDSDYALMEGEIANAKKAYCDIDTDIKTTDTLVIEGTNYRVRHVSEYEMTGMSHLKVILEY